MLDPRKFCQKCSTKWSNSTDACTTCGFDPVEKPGDEQTFVTALEEFLSVKA